MEIMKDTETVTISKKEYEDLLRVKANDNYRLKLEKGFEELHSGKGCVKKTLAELRRMENE